VFTTSLGNARPVINDNLNGIVINLMNTSAALESASHSVSTDEKGNFAAQNANLKPGIYKIEAGKEGYLTSTTSVNVGSGNTQVELLLRLNNNRQSIRVNSSDADKIINPGEVNIRPPSM
jgi:hypothetical protein